VPKGVARGKEACLKGDSTFVISLIAILNMEKSANDLLMLGDKLRRCLYLPARLNV
jgi:hypothetical protein